MCEGGDGVQRKTAKEIIADSFRELAQEKSVDKIAVGDIVANCKYSQATFYRHFKGKYDLIAWEYAQRVEEIMARIDADGYPWKQTLVDGALLFQAERDYLVNLLRHTGGHDSCVMYMTQINYSALKRYILKRSGEADLDKTTDLYVRIYVHGTVNVHCEWVLGLYEVTPEELAEACEMSLPEPLRRYLLR